MDATDRIVEEFNRLVAIGHSRIPEQSLPEQVVYFVVATRCEIDMEGFESVYQWAFTPLELKILIDGLRLIREEELADEFACAFELLQQDGFYEHRYWIKVSANVQNRIFEIGKRVERRLWDLDEKLVAILAEPRADLK